MAPLPSWQVYDEPTILLAKRVTGEEEVPDGVVGLVRCGWGGPAAGAVAGAATGPWCFKALLPTVCSLALAGVLGC